MFLYEESGLDSLIEEIDQKLNPDKYYKDINRSTIEL